MEEFLKSIGITQKGVWSRNNSYVIDLDDSNAFGKIYSILENNEDLDYLEDNSLLTINNASVTYRYEDQYQLQLLADFDNDSYKLVVSGI